MPTHRTEEPFKTKNNNYMTSTLTRNWVVFDIVSYNKVRIDLMIIKKMGKSSTGQMKILKMTIMTLMKMMIKDLFFS